MNFRSAFYIISHLNLKTVRFNFKYFDLPTALHFPVFLAGNVVTKKMLGKVKLPGKIYPGMVKVGFGDVGIFDKRKSRAIWEVCGEVRFNGKADIGHGSKICVGENAALTIGHNFNITAESSIVCFKAIDFGNDCLIAWNVLIIDTDFHRMYCSNELMNPDKPISIGDRVWIGMNTKILKGALISNDSVVAAGSLVNKQFERKNVLLAGIPAKVVKESVTWEV